MNENHNDHSRLELHIPTRPFGLIDAINRRAAAIGSIGYAMATSNASYNGHYVTVAWNDYRGYWICEHYWGERVVHCRGELAACIRAAISEYDRGALGSSVHVHLRSPADIDLIPTDLMARLTAGPEPKGEPVWYSPWIEHALRTNTTHLLIEADKSDGNKEKVYLRLAFPRSRTA